MSTPMTGGLGGPTKRWCRPIVRNRRYALAREALPWMMNGVRCRPQTAQDPAGEGEQGAQQAATDETACVQARKHLSQQVSWQSAGLLSACRQPSD